MKKNWIIFAFSALVCLAAVYWKFFAANAESQLKKDLSALLLQVQPSLQFSGTLATVATSFQKVRAIEIDTLTDWEFLRQQSSNLRNSIGQVAVSPGHAERDFVSDLDFLAKRIATGCDEAVAKQKDLILERQKPDNVLFGMRENPDKDVASKQAAYHSQIAEIRRDINQIEENLREFGKNFREAFGAKIRQLPVYDADQVELNAAFEQFSEEVNKTVAAASGQSGIGAASESDRTSKDLIFGKSLETQNLVNYYLNREQR